MTRVTDQMCRCTGVLLPYSSDYTLHRWWREVLDQVEVKSCVGGVRDDGDMCRVCADEQVGEKRADALKQLVKLTSPIVRLVNHDHQVQRLRTFYR